MTVEILTPDQVLFQGEATSIQLPGSDGLFEVLSNHAPLIAALNGTRGNIKLTTSDGVTNFEITDGFVECLHNNVTVTLGSAKQI